MWDERADPTDQSYKVIDKDFLASIGSPAPPTINQAATNTSLSNNTTIGDIQGSRITTAEETGTISYTSFMDKFLLETQNYFTNIFNKNKEVTKQYNNAVRQLWTVQRNYQKGTFLSNNEKDGNKIDTPLFGKPINIEQNLNKVFADFAENITTNDSSNLDEFMIYITDTTLNLSTKTKRTIRENYLNFVKNKRGTFPNALTQIIQSTVNSEQNYLQYLSRANTISYDAKTVGASGTDGLQEPNGNTIVYDIAGIEKNGVNSLTEMNADIKKISEGLISFDIECSTENKFTFGSDTLTGYLFYGDPGEKIDNNNNTGYESLMKNVFYPFTSNEYFNRVGNLSFKREYMILSDDVVDLKKYQTFKTAIIGNIINDKNNIDNSRVGESISTLFDNYWVKIARPLFIKENDATNTFLDSMEKDTDKLKNYLKYTPFPSKIRELSYTIGDSSALENQAQVIKSLGATTNTNTSTTTWNDSLGGSVAYISKVKLN
jgi:hypothetical protein